MKLNVISDATRKTYNFVQKEIDNATILDNIAIDGITLNYFRESVKENTLNKIWRDTISSTSSSVSKGLLGDIF